MSSFSPENILLIGSIILIVGVILGKSIYRSGLPLLLIFLLIGMGFGCDGVGIQFDDIHSAQLIGMIALCIILYSGGLSTSISSIRPVIAPGLVLSTAGVLLTTLFTGLFIFWLSGLPWTNIHFALMPSVLLAATMSSTDSASVFGILGSQKVQLKHNLRPLLELESGSNDPMAYMLTIILIEAIQLDKTLSAGAILAQLGLQFGVGTAFGFIMGYGSRWLVSIYRRIGNRNEDAGQATAMSSIILLASVFFTFTLTQDLGGNGYLAVYLSGIIIGNSPIPHRRSISKFMDAITWCAQIVMFLILGLLVNPHEMLSTSVVAIIIALFIMVIGRPASVFISLLPFRKISRKSKLFISWVGLRGAVPIIFATYPVVAQVEGSSQIFNIVFFITLISLLLQGTSVIKSAKVLNLVNTESHDDEDFGIELSDENTNKLETLHLTEQHLAAGNTLRDMNLPMGTLVIMIKRNEQYIVPNGKRKLHPGDALLILKESSDPK